jgi:UDP:flavonoid glycosyltransferase YjiC (YdhE family)
LCTYAGGSGHADPLVPVAGAVRAAGHDVAFFGRRSAAAALDANGFTLFADADDRALAAGDDAAITPLLELDMEREYRDLRGFADRIGRARMDRVVALVDEWRPDLLVCDEADYGCMVGAARLRLHHASATPQPESNPGIGRSGTHRRPRLAAGERPRVCLRVRGRD